MTTTGVTQVPAAKEAAQPANAVVDERVRKAAKEFEAMLISSLWQMAKSGLGSDDSESDGAAGNIQDLAVHALGAGVSKAGGFGLSEMLIRSLAHGSANPQATDTQGVTGGQSEPTPATNIRR